jgi:hypothetical protein
MDDDRRASAQRNTERDEVQISGAHDGLLRHSEKQPYDLPPERRTKTRSGHVAGSDRRWRDPAHKGPVIEGESATPWHESFWIPLGVSRRPVKDG